MESETTKNTSIESNSSFDSQPVSIHTSKSKKILLFITGPWTFRNAIEWLILILAIIVMKGFIIDQYLIPSDSMEPTLHGGGLLAGDRVLVNKCIYGIRIPFTTIWLTRWHHPQRWEIVVLKSPEKKLWRENLIKRVVALPGETVRIKNGRVEVNGVEIEPPFNLQDKLYYYNLKDLLHLLFTTEDENTYKTVMRILEKYPYRYGCIESDEFIKVPPRHYFVLGDNSLNSIDSRYYGWIPETDIIGRAFAIWWPINRMRDFTGFSRTWWGKCVIYGLPLLIITVVLYLLFQQLKTLGLV